MEDTQTGVHAREVLAAIAARSRAAGGGVWRVCVRALWGPTLVRLDHVRRKARVAVAGMSVKQQKVMSEAKLSEECMRSLCEIPFNADDDADAHNDSEDDDDDDDDDDA